MICSIDMHMQYSMELPENSISQQFSCPSTMGASSPLPAFFFGPALRLHTVVAPALSFVLSDLPGSFGPPFFPHNLITAPRRGTWGDEQLAPR